MKDGIKETAEKGHRRLWRRRWTAPCKECGAIIVWLDNTQPQEVGKKWSPWKMVEVFGVRNGEPLFWDGGIAYNPRVHVDHWPNCTRQRQKLAWIIRREREDL